MGATLELWQRHSMPFLLGQKRNYLLHSIKASFALTDLLRGWLISSTCNTHFPTMVPIMCQKAHYILKTYTEPPRVPVPGFSPSRTEVCCVREVRNRLWYQSTNSTHVCVHVCFTGKKIYRFHKVLKVLHNSQRAKSHWID